jgi:hypothetical protein
MNNQSLIDQLQSSVNDGIVWVENELLAKDASVLNFKPTAEQWSVLECLEHLNRYSRYYNHHLEVAFNKATNSKAFRPGWLGGYFTRSVAPENAKPMKTRPHLNPVGSKLDKGVALEFLEHQRQLLQLLSKARKANLNKRAIRVEVMPIIRIKTGDALSFLIAHQDRHLQQADRMLRTAEPATGYPQKSLSGR